MSEKNLKNIDFKTMMNREYFPSPCAWEDHVLYFLMLDRFSDEKERGYIDNQGVPVVTGETPIYTSENKGNAVKNAADRENWFESGGRFVGGTLSGLESKIGYLKRLGIGAIWISPIFKQLVSGETYHGYGIQNFLNVDPRFGTKEDLRKVVTTAHAHGIYVILDIILNHTGDVFEYNPDRYETWSADGVRWLDSRWDGFPYAVKGFRDKTGSPILPFKPQEEESNAWPDGAVWPAEFQQAEVFTRKGHIQSWDYYPEYIEGDFCSLKDIHLGKGGTDDYQPSPALMALCEVYKYWIAFADIDGFRVDTVKHMDEGATRFFTSNIHEFAQSLGKENFYLIGEITGGRQNAFRILETTGLDAALGINDIPDKLEYMVKGYRNPEDYFNLFRNSLLVQKDSHVWFKNRVVTTIDDHDQVRKGARKARFCHEEAPGHESMLLGFSALAVLATTLGIPCIYYGSEQGFDGHGDNDRYLRESMFGGAFGAFESRNCHFFNEAHPIYQALQKLLSIRKNHIALRRGRQYLRPISGDGENFGLPKILGGAMRSIIAWSRIFDNHEMIVAINTDPKNEQRAWITLDDGLHQTGECLVCLYSNQGDLINGTIAVEARNGKAIKMTLAPAGFAIYH